LRETRTALSDPVSKFDVKITMAKRMLDPRASTCRLTRPRC
jgi:hypothetical protein